MDVPTSAQAALVFLVIVLPGFLAQGGYRVGRAVPEHPQGLVAIARVIALSTLIALAAWKLGGKDVFDHARAATALTAYESETYRFALALFFIPPLVGYVAGQGVDAVARRVADALDRLPDSPSEAEGWNLRIRPKTLGTISPRLVNEGPTTWDRTWRRLRRSEPFAYAASHNQGRTRDHRSGSA
jgi:hypothetical protein